MNIGRPFLRLLGHPALLHEDEAAPLPQKAFALLAILHLASDRRALRSTLAAWIYEDADQTGAMANLRQLLSRIHTRQKHLGIELIATGRDEVRLVSGETAPTCDLDRLMALPVPAHADDLEALSGLYRGDLLESFTADGETLSGWIGTQRNRLRERYGDLVTAGARHVRGGRAETALRRLLEIDPFREDAWLTLVEIRAQTQGLSAAEAVYDEMRRRFGAELGATPSEPVRELLVRLKRAVAVPAPLAAARPLDAGRRVETLLATAAVAAIPRVCLLMPTASSGVDAEHTHLAEALIEDVTLGLCRLRSIAVIAPHTAWRLGAEDQPKERFGIEYFAETSVRNFAGRTRLVVKLMRQAGRVTLWADDYDLAVGASAEHHRTLSRSIALALADQIERSEAAAFTIACPPSAYQLYLLGRRHLRVLDLPDVRRARRAFIQAADNAPAFAPALNGIARSLVLEWLLLARTEPDLLHQAKRVAMRAANLDPFSGEALREVASASLFLGGLDEAVEGLAEAERLVPHHADILADHANALTHSCDALPALRRIEKAIDLNPIPPDDYLWTAGSTLFLVEDYEKALVTLARMQQRKPAYRLTAACLAMTGQTAEAARFVARALEDQPNFRIDAWIKTMPLRSKDHLARYAGALSMAGFT
ncbi:BTAD domain-containing putative transcriptional regulator [Aureimonas sp. AU12]|uniref:BTAD domain-containing putative transcriptional regulator n=1 Tax=Aureimonas sp. AU12 TaxID=1638161 RepID=UPI0007858431|nr:BTAD domain-containing putative transcriptional regulator [Aureimonas sp. AU12]